MKGNYPSTIAKKGPPFTDYGVFKHNLGVNHGFVSVIARVVCQWALWCAFFHAADNMLITYHVPKLHI